MANIPEHFTYSFLFNCTQVSSTASDLVSHMLKSQLLMSPDMWQILLSTLLRALPVLQVSFFLLSLHSMVYLSRDM